jgi:DNA processing protein
VLFWVGDLALTRSTCVAVVGTRRCTPEGASVAYQLGYDLSAAGVCVVSGLAAGIDGAAHAGALAAAHEVPGAGSTVGVSASGVDVPYPPQHRGLYAEVGRLGAVISETPPGRQAQAWRFPSRNRLIAGLTCMVVVVESHASGGSWHTVDAALRRGVDVCAVPGSVRSPASVGTNTLLHEGAAPVRNAQDVLEAIGLEVVQATPVTEAASPRLPGLAEPAGPMAALEGSVLSALGWQRSSIDLVVERSGLPLGAVVVALGRLEEQGVATEEAGWWRRCQRAR